MVPLITLRSAATDTARHACPSPENLTRSLRALGHPLTLACVAALLLNDHVFKRLYPSALTGKLSDLAGLFFFPFLLTAFLAVIGAGLLRLGSTALQTRARFNARRSAMEYSAYLLTAFFFSITKVSPSFNAALNLVLRRLSGLPIHIALDPTDLVALVVLVPSYLLLKSVDVDERASSTRRPLVAVGLACLAVLATSPCPPAQPITHLVPTDEGVYALAVAWEPISSAFISRDAGRSWDYRETDSLPPDVLAAAEQPTALPKIVCAPGEDQVCYRIQAEEKLEVSADGGQTWEVAWSVPSSRRAYMARLASGHGRMLACGKDLDLRANDLVVVGSGNDHTAIVALGNEGVLRGDYDSGDWTRVGVGWAEPTPVSGGLDDLFPPMIIQGETLLAMGVAVAAFCLLSILAWARLETGEEPPEAGRGGRSPWVVGILVDLCLLALMALVNLEELIVWVAPPLIVLTVVVASMYAGWSKAVVRAGGAGEAQRALKVTSIAAVLVGALAWIPFGLWVLGTIPGYSAALIIAILGVVLTTVHAHGRLPRPSRPDSPES